MTRQNALVAVLLTFLLGIGNFAMHRAVLDRLIPMLRELPASLLRFGGQASLAAEFVLLLGALLLVASGHPGWGWAYLGYTALNAAGAWLIVTRRG